MNHSLPPLDRCVVVGFLVLSVLAHLQGCTPQPVPRASVQPVFVEQLLHCPGHIESAGAHPEDVYDCTRLEREWDRDLVERHPAIEDEPGGQNT